ncbi:hypothetical protein I4F81_006041 [Pyropia yezoensis]|uniref:Uncharacterized protein n=1 Tax=Pyropia yezoensis TaxID=2788 RepID=A0ACC3C0K9_PYRYE|nr:hypothetical protein I4F81_006041 [Neopyropia yezoensis]
MASAMSSVKHLAVMFGAMSLMKAVDQEDPQVIAYCRLLFGAYLFATWALHTYIHVGIARNGDKTTRVTVPAKPPSPFSLPPPPPPAAADGAVVAAAAPPPPAAPTVQSVGEYDAGVLAASKKALLMNAVILTGVHLKMGTVSPLVLTSLTGLTRLVDEPLVQLYVLGRAAAGKLARPFAPEVNPLMAMMAGGGAAGTTAAGTAAAGAAADAGAPGAAPPPSAGAGTASGGAAASRVATLLGAGTATSADDDLAGSDDDSDDGGRGDLIPDASEDEDEGGGAPAAAAAAAKKRR